MTLVPDYRTFADAGQGLTQRDTGTAAGAKPTRHAGWVYPVAKRVFDLSLTTVLLLPATLIVAAALLVLNPYFNPGPLLYRQTRMGRGCKPFRAVKFRTMSCAGRRRRGPHDPVETECITRLGQWLRRSHFDELPQILNVYRGEMSLIGPRPDTFRHALHFVREVPQYRERHAVMPGITGLAQVELGYAEGLTDTHRKTGVDLDYIANAGFALDTRIALRTMVAVIRLKGY